MLPWFAVSLPFLGGRQPALRQHGHESLIAFVDPLLEKVKRRKFAEFHLNPSQRPDLVPAGSFDASFVASAIDSRSLSLTSAAPTNKNVFFRALKALHSMAVPLHAIPSSASGYRRAAVRRACPDPSVAFFPHATVSS